MDPLPLALVSPPSPDRDQFLASAPESPVEIFDSVDAFLDRPKGEGEWGILLMGPGLPSEDVLRLLREQGDRGIPWSPLLVEEEEGRFLTRALSLSVPLDLAEVAEIAAHPLEKGPVLELHWVLRVVSRARHDLNNPLTAGLAEVQLLLMDDHGPEVGEAMEIIQEQFRRLRDMVAALGCLRPKKRPPPG